MSIRRSQQGHLMVGLMAAIALMMIFSTVAVQAWQDVLRRDLEAEMMFRAQEIVRAIKRYEKDQGGKLPDELADLMKAGNKGQYFLRRLYLDPLVKDGKWGLLCRTPQGGIHDPNAPAVPEAGAIGSSPIVQITDIPGAPVPEGQAVEKGCGAMGIAGVKSLSKDTPFRVHKGQREYAQWLFTIFDLLPPNAPGAGQPNPPGSPPSQGAPGN